MSETENTTSSVTRFSSVRLKTIALGAPRHKFLQMVCSLLNSTLVFTTGVISSTISRLPWFRGNRFETKARGCISDKSRFSGNMEVLNQMVGDGMRPMVHAPPAISFSVGGLWFLLSKRSTYWCLACLTTKTEGRGSSWHEATENGLSALRRYGRGADLPPEVEQVISATFANDFGSWFETIERELKDQMQQSEDEIEALVQRLEDFRLELRERRAELNASGLSQPNEKANEGFTSDNR